MGKSWCTLSKGEPSYGLLPVELWADKLWGNQESEFCCWKRSQSRFAYLEGFTIVAKVVYGSCIVVSEDDKSEASFMDMLQHGLRWNEVNEELVMDLLYSPKLPRNWIIKAGK